MNLGLLLEKLFQLLTQHLYLVSTKKGTARVARAYLPLGRIYLIATGSKLSPKSPKLIGSKRWKLSG